MVERYKHGDLSGYSTICICVSSMEYVPERQLAVIPKSEVLSIRNISTLFKLHKFIGVHRVSSLVFLVTAVPVHCCRN
jgi:hypothetical protein